MLAQTQALLFALFFFLCSSICNAAPLVAPMPPPQSTPVASSSSLSSSLAPSDYKRDHLTKRNALQARDDIEPILSLGLDALDAIKEIVSDIVDLDDAMHTAESTYTTTLLSSLQSQYPSSNVMICHDPAAYDLENAVHAHQECDIGLGFTYGYEIFVFDYGTFSNGGDGGYINWAFGGSFTTDGNDVTFYSMD